MKQDIFHIYWSTSGSSGLYLDEIYQCLKDHGYKQMAFVNYFYPFDYGEKVFFKYSDQSHTLLKGTTRRIVQAIEILYAFLQIIVKARKYKPELINFSLVGGSYTIVVFFLYILKVFACKKIVITCHDVKPLTGYMCLGKEEKNRRKIFKLADFLLIHNNNSREDLTKYYHICENKIVQHPFPLMNLNKIFHMDDVEKDIDFLFIGVIRPEKGLDILLDAWVIFYKMHPNSNLYVCGQPVTNIERYKNLSDCNVTMNLGYINDYDYCKYILRSKFVVLPYKTGTNSGIVSTVSSLNSNIIYSDIPMFKNNPMLDNRFVFKSEDVDSLVEIMNKVYNTNISESYKTNYEVVYKNEFEKGVMSVYAGMLEEKNE